MNQKICNQVRSEIEHKELTTPLSGNSNHHLRNCSDCQEFQDKETRLRQMVGSLQTVNAPADFDFRLRARLASEQTRQNNWLTSPMHVWRLRSLAVAAMLLIFAATVVMIRQTEKSNRDSTVANGRSSSSGTTTEVQPQPKGVEQASSGPSSNDDFGAAPEKPTQAASILDQRRPTPPVAFNKRPQASVDFSNVSAPVVRQDDKVLAVFPLEVPQQSFTVSLDDGRGMSRTISVPTVSFGSRRVLTSGTVSPNQFAPKGDW